MSGHKQKRKTTKPDSVMSGLLMGIHAKPLPEDFEPEECCRCGRLLSKGKYHGFWDGDTPKAECWPCHKFFST